MKRLRLGVIAVLVALGAAQPQQVAAAHVPAQRIVAQATVEILPDPLGSFFAGRLDAVIERAVEPDGAWLRNPKYRARNQWHYLMLDAAAEQDSRRARIKAAESFPLSRPAARKLFRTQKIKRGGLLPWELEDLTQELAAAFGSGNEDRIIELAGYVVHFSADAADPFCCTQDRRGEASGNLIFGDPAMGDALFAHQDVNHRIGWELIRRNAHRYRLAIQTTSIEHPAQSAVAEEILAVMVESLRDLDAFCKADAELFARMNIQDAAAFDSRMDEYYLLLDEKCEALCVKSLTRGTTLAARLITGAWAQAGSPVLGSTVVATAKAQSTTPPASASGAQSPPAQKPVGSMPYVASKRSKVFHRSDCSHAHRISPHNLIDFADITEAQDSGRRPCRACRPDQN